MQPAGRTRSKVPRRAERWPISRQQRIDTSILVVQALYTRRAGTAFSPFDSHSELPCKSRQPHSVVGDDVVNRLQGFTPRKHSSDDVTMTNRNCPHDDSGVLKSRD
jgi:hypothetical protein